MERTGAGSGLGEVDEGGGQKQQRKHREGQDHEHAALRLGERIAALEGVALIEEENARQNAADKARQAQQRIEVAARQTQDHAERAAEEHQAADHHKHAQHKARDRRASAARGKFLLAERHKEAAQHKADDLRPDVLHRRCRVQAESARRIAQEACDAEAHVLRVAEQHEQRSDHADHKTGKDHVSLFMFQCHTLSSLLQYSQKFFVLLKFYDTFRRKSNCLFG